MKAENCATGIFCAVTLLYKVDLAGRAHAGLFHAFLIDRYSCSLYNKLHLYWSL